MTVTSLQIVIIALLSTIGGSHQAECDVNDFTCSDGTCIDNLNVCDGEKHCPDGSDETKKLCTDLSQLCFDFMFRCLYGACIDSHKKCDGKPDCADNSDETHPDCGISTSTTSDSVVNQCPDHSFQCKSGQCISTFDVCDGKDNCIDGSDETEASCLHLPCPETIGFKCTYGGCIDILKKCNEIKDCKDGSDEDPSICGSPTTPQPPETFTRVQNQYGCILPDQPYGGSYKVSKCIGDWFSNKCRGAPGTLVEPSTEIVYQCGKGFKLHTTNNKSLCLDSSWYPELPTCLKLCKPLLSNSLDVTCTYKGSPVPCTKEPVFPKTKAALRCKQSFHHQGDPVGVHPVCDSEGRWTEPLFRCEPECGIIANDQVLTLITFGEEVSSLEYPWHAGLFKYKKELNDIELFCGGTILTPFMILTAANCLFFGNTSFHASEINVAVGKTNRSWEIQEPNEQRFQVNNIFIHSDYRGVENNYGFDLAILELSENIVIGSMAMPICMETIPPWTLIPDGTSLTATGWGYNEFNKLSETLKAVNITYLNQRVCKREAGAFRTFITADKFCARYTDGAGFQLGDYGGGLVSLKPENDRYFIWGVMSIKPPKINTYGSFTNITEKTHASFIREIRQKLSHRF